MKPSQAKPIHVYVCIIVHQRFLLYHIEYERNSSSSNKMFCSFGFRQGRKWNLLTHSVCAEYFFWRHVTKAVNVFNAKSHYETGNLIKELLRSASDICTKMSASTHKTKIRKKIIKKNKSRTITDKYIKWMIYSPISVM